MFHSHLTCSFSCVLEGTWYLVWTIPAALAEFILALNMYYTPNTEMVKGSCQIHKIRIVGKLRAAKWFLKDDAYNRNIV